jgi:hypothetical protein
LTLSASDVAPAVVGQLALLGQMEPAGGWERSDETADDAQARLVRGGTVVRDGTPSGSARLTADLPLAVAGEAPLRITADGNEPRPHHLYGDVQVRYSPGGILDVAVRVERRDESHRAAVKLIGRGLPESLSQR